MTPTASVQTIRAQFHPKFRFLAEPHPYKVLYGGRDGMKSWGIAQQLVINASQRKLRWLCARETQKSMKDSVHKLLGDTISRLNLGDAWRVLQDGIHGANGSEFLFSGIKDAKNIKSYEGCDGAWVEEAQVVSKASWDILLPTIRKPGSEIWVSFNPELETDDTYKRWVLSPPPGCVVVKIGWSDNLWLSDTSRNLIEHMRRTDPKGFEHVYGGQCISEIEGAIFADELRKVDSSDRICLIPYDPTRPVHTAWDLGFGDPTCIWFVQAYDGFLNFIDYAAEAGKTISDHVIMLQQRGYMYGTDHLPHDAIDNIIHTKLIGNGDKSLSIPVLMQKAGRKVQVAPKLLKTEALNAAKTLFPLCRFDAVKCADGLQGLRHYQWDREQSTSENPAAKPGQRKPLHDWASHPADGFMTAAVSIKRETYQPGVRKPPPRARVAEI